MDEMNIRTNFMQTLIAKMIKRAVRQKAGYNIDLRFNEPIQVTFDGDKANLHIGLDVELKKEDLQNLLKELV